MRVVSMHEENYVKSEVAAAVGMMACVSSYYGASCFG